MNQIISKLATFLGISYTTGDNHAFLREDDDNSKLLILVHGFTGTYRTTWGQFPELIIGDSSLSDYDLLLWGYPTSLFRSSPEISRIGERLKTELDHLPERYQHIVIAAHSMGGLVVRATIVSALTQGQRPDLTKLKHIVLFGTPNEGIEKADRIPRSVKKQINDMKTTSRFIIDLRNQWLDRVYRADKIDDQYHLAIPTTTVAGLEDRFVPHGSVSTFFSDSETTDGDHRGMVKPPDTSHSSFKILRKRMLEPAPLYDAVAKLPDLLHAKPNSLPFASLGSLFKGREAFLDDLHEQLNESHQGTTAITDKADPQRAHAVHGTGGIGKTRAAIEYAWRNAYRYNAMLFLSAQTPEILHSNLAGLTEFLPITGLEQAPDKQRTSEVLKWLQTHPGWLVILDNVDTSPAAAAVKALFPLLTQGHVLITSRLSQWSAGVKTLDLGVLELTDATDYLLEATDVNRIHTELDAIGAEQIALKVGQLALGLEHAAAYINARYLGLNDYLAQWQRDEAKILETFDLDLIEYPKELLVTWKLSVDQLDDHARELLDVLSWLAPEPIPDMFFQSAPDQGHVVAREAIATLCKYSLANRIQEGQQQGFQIHRLVQASARYHQKAATDSELPALEKALAWTNEVYQGNPWDVRDWPLLEPLVEHVQTVCEFGDEHQKRGEGYSTSRLLNDLGQFFRSKARNAAAEPLMRRALTIDEKSFGEDHPKVAIDLNNLAQLLKATNRLSEAEPLMRRALTIDEKSFGEDHPNVAIRLNNLAQLLKATNRLSEAEPLMRRAVEIFHDFGKATGHVHPHMEVVSSNYKSLLVEAGLSPEEALNRVQEIFA